MKVSALDIREHDTKMLFKKYSVLHRKLKMVWREITDVKKGMVIAFFHINEKISVVAMLFIRQWSNIYNFLTQARDQGHIHTAPMSGWPIILSTRKYQEIVWVAIKDRSMICLEVQNQYALHVSI